MSCLTPLSKCYYLRDNVATTISLMENQSLIAKQHNRIVCQSNDSDSSRVREYSRNASALLVTPTFTYTSQFTNSMKMKFYLRSPLIELYDIHILTSSHHFRLKEDYMNHVHARQDWTTFYWWKHVRKMIFCYKIRIFSDHTQRILILYDNLPHRIHLKFSIGIARVHEFFYKKLFSLNLRPYQVILLHYILFTIDYRMT